MQSPKYDTGRIAAFLYPLTEQMLEVVSECRRIIPNMCGELRPEKHTQRVEQLLVAEVVRLMRLSERVEPSLADHLDSRFNLLIAESMALT